jgi:DinB superfamily
MKNSLSKSVDLLGRTPDLLEAMLSDIDEEWSKLNEGDETWSAYDVVGHLIHGEKTDWIPRAKIIMEQGVSKTFDPFDRFAMKKLSAGKSLNQLLAEFKKMRVQSLGQLSELNLTDQDLNKKGIHPSFGPVTMLELISCWVVHDLNHISQISRVLAFQLKDDVGPWEAYLRILKGR